MAVENYYTSLTTNIRFTDDISFKLLGLVPLFSGAGLLVAIMRSEYIWSPAIYAVGAFGALVTLGLFRWELRNIQNCLWLIRCCSELEETEYAAKPGQFYRRPSSPMRIGKAEAEKLIYGVTIFAWLLLPWLVYTAAQAKNSSPLLIHTTLNNIYIALAVIVGIFAVVSMVVPLNVDPKPPST